MTVGSNKTGTGVRAKGMMGKGRQEESKTKEQMRGSAGVQPRQVQGSPKDGRCWQKE